MVQTDHPTAERETRQLKTIGEHVLSQCRTVALAQKELFLAFFVYIYKQNACKFLKFPMRMWQLNSMSARQRGRGQGRDDDEPRSGSHQRSIAICRRWLTLYYDKESKL